MLEFLEFIKPFLTLATVCLWLWGASGHVVVRRYHSKKPTLQNWQSYKSMFTDSSYPVHTEFRETVLGMGGFLVCILLLTAITFFYPAWVNA